MAFFGNLFGKSVKAGSVGPIANVNQSALNLIMDQIKDLIEINTSLNKKYRDLESKLSGLNADVGSDKKSVTELQKKLGELQSNMEKFIGLYEVITNQFNPFVDTGEETDNYEIDSNGNPVPFKRPSYGSVSSIPSRYGAQGPIPEGGSVVVTQPSLAEQMPEGVEMENVRKPEVLSDKKTADNLGAEKDMFTESNIANKMGDNVLAARGAGPGSDMAFMYDNSVKPERTFSSGSVLDRLDVNAIVPLTSISGNVNSITTVLSWMVYLSKQCGENATDVLSYYTEIGWISNNIAKVLSSYLVGIHVKPDDDSDGKMDVSDHVVSLFFIAKIKGVNVNAKTYRLISKIVKSKGFIIDEE